MRAQTWDTHEPAGDWLPIASAPSIAYVGGYEIGYRLQDSGEPNQLQRVALRIAGVPDGQPSQPYNAEPYCVTRVGTPWATSSQRGPSCSSRATAPMPSRCRSARAPAAPPGACRGRAPPRASPSSRAPCRCSSARRSASAHAARATPFDGVRAADPPGGRPTSAARSTRRAADGSVTGRAMAPEEDVGHASPSLAEAAFPRPGLWTLRRPRRGRGRRRGVSPRSSAARGRRRSRSTCAATSAAAAAASTAPARPPPALHLHRRSTRRRPPAARSTITLYRVTGCYGLSAPPAASRALPGCFGATASPHHAQAPEEGPLPRPLRVRRHPLPAREQRPQPDVPRRDAPQLRLREKLPRCP